jgi:methionine-rich copper-binding protein CopC
MGRRIGWALLFALVSSLAAPARAHAHLIQASPGDGVTLVTAPARIDLVFDEELDEAKSRVRVYDASGDRADRDDQQVTEKRMTIGVRDWPPGVYRVRWLSVAHDDQGESRGDFTFTIGMPPAGQPYLFVTPERSDAGQTVTIAGAGFTPNALVLLAIGDELRSLAAPRTDTQGRFAVQAVVPVYLPHGRQVIQALDLDARMATAALNIDRGGWPPLGIEVSVEAQGTNRVAVEIRLVNRSGWYLRRIDVRASIPQGTRVIREGLEGPAGVEAKVEAGQVRWSNAGAAPHQMLDGFSYVLDTAAVPPGAPRPAPTATVSFEHGTPPVFRDQVTVP